MCECDQPVDLWDSFVLLLFFFFSDLVFCVCAGDQPVDLLNSLLGSGRRVELVVAVDAGAGTTPVLAGRGTLRGSCGQMGPRGAVFPFSWTTVCERRNSMPPLSAALSAKSSFSVLSASEAADAAAALDAAAASAALRQQQLLRVHIPPLAPLGPDEVKDERRRRKKLVFFEKETVSFVRCKRCWTELKLSWVTC